MIYNQRFSSIATAFSFALAAVVHPIITTAADSTGPANQVVSVDSEKLGTTDAIPGFESIYNQGVAEYREGEYARARDLFTRSTAVADRALEAKARFNLANCDYAEAVTLREENPEEAIGKLETAISHYRGAIEANPHDADARANAELAQLLIDQIRQDQQQQDQQNEQNQDQQNEQQQDQQQQNEQNQDQQQQDQQNQDRQNEQQQDQQNEQNQDQQNEQQQDQQNQDRQNEQQQDQQNEQQQQQNEQQQDQQQQNEQNQDQQNEQNQDQQNEQQQDQQNEQQQDQQNEQQQDQRNEDQQNEQQSQHDSRPGEQGNPSGQQPTGSSATSPVPKGELPHSMTQEEAEKMLQAVRDRDLRRRYEKLRKTERYYQPVDRDW